MADSKRPRAAGGRSGAGESTRGRAANTGGAGGRGAGRAAAGEAADATRAVGRAAARTAGEAGRRGGEAMLQGGEAVAEAARESGDAVRRGGKAAAEIARGAGEAAERGAEAASEAAREGMEAAAQGQSRFVRGAAEEMEKTGRSLVGIVEEAAAGMRSLMVGAPGLNPGGFQDAQQAVSRLVQGVMETNMRFADELLRRTGPSAVVDLQRQFLREYFDALAQGGTMLLRAARQAAEESLRPLERTTRERGGGTVADVMSKDVKVASPDDTVQQAARLMGEHDTGALPVGEGDRLVGMVTDRDIAVRAAAAGKDPSKTKLREVMSGGEPRHVFADEAVESAAAAMAEQQVQRLPVLDRDKRLVGIVSLGDLARAGAAAGAGAGGGGGGADSGGGAERALAGISRPGGRHNQNGPASSG